MSAAFKAGTSGPDLHSLGEGGPPVREIPANNIIARPLWIPGVVYAGETDTQAAARETRLRELDAEYAAQEQRIAAWRARGWWE